MKPILRDRQDNVIGRLDDVISCTVTEERNGAFIASFTYPYTGVYYNQIDYDCIVIIKPNQKTHTQQFRVNSISKPINGIVTYGCEHISYELARNPITPASGEGGAQAAMSAIVNHAMINNGDYTLYSDILTSKRFEFEFISVREAIKKVQEYYGGELEWNEKDIYLHNQRGNQDAIILRYGETLLDYTNSIDVSSVYTAIVPYIQKDSENGKITVTLPEKYLTYSNYTDYAYVRAKSVNFSLDFTEEEMEMNKSAIQNRLRTLAYEYINNNPPKEMTNSITLSYVDLRKAKEFDLIETMQDLSLCDYVIVQDPRLGINYRGKVVRTVFNAITEMYNSIEIGNPDDSLLDNLSSLINRSKTIGKSVDDIEKNLDEYFSKIEISEHEIKYTSGNIKNEQGIYNTCAFKIEREANTQSSGYGRIISITNPKNQKTRIIRT